MTPGERDIAPFMQALQRQYPEKLNKIVGPAYCRAKMYASNIACCPLVSASQYADRTADGLTDYYITLSNR